MIKITEKSNPQNGTSNFKLQNSTSKFCILSFPKDLLVIEASIHNFNFSKLCFGKVVGYIFR